MINTFNKDLSDETKQVQILSHEKEQLTEATEIETPVDKGFFKKRASRRFSMAMLVILVSSVMVWKGLIEPSNYETLMIWISGIYIIGKPFGDQVARFLIAK